MKITFHTVQVDTSGDGVELPDGAIIDSVEHVSMGEYVNVAYHVVKEGNDDDARKAKA